MTRIEREQRTVEAMIRLYCANHHKQESLCLACDTLLTYALKRLEQCPFQAEKPTCSKCPIHCYKPEMRKRITEVMRYAGPRMLRHHPWLALCHLWDSFHKPNPSQTR